MSGTTCTMSGGAPTGRSDSASDRSPAATLPPGRNASAVTANRWPSASTAYVTDKSTASIPPTASLTGDAYTGPRSVRITKPRLSTSQ